MCDLHFEISKLPWLLLALCNVSADSVRSLSFLFLKQPATSRFAPHSKLRYLFIRLTSTLSLRREVTPEARAGPYQLFFERQLRLSLTMTFRLLKPSSERLYKRDGQQQCSDWLTRALLSHGAAC